MKAARMRAALPAAMVGALFALPAGAETLELTPDRTATIAMSRTSRVLVGFPALAPQLGEEWISTATLHLPLAGAGGRWELPLEVNGLARAWDAAATWTSPWETPGGDRESGIPAATEPVLSGAVGELAVDVTDIVRAMAAGEIGDHGFLVLPADPERMGLSEADLALLGSLSAARLTVHYWSLTELGYRGGPQALLARRKSGEMGGGRRP